MFLSNPAKSFLPGVLILLLLSGCRFWQGEPKPEALPVPEIKNDLPFLTKEPENFQCEMVVTAGGIVRKTFLVRKGDRRRIDYDFGEEKQRSFVRGDKDRIISYRHKIYAELPAGQTDTGVDAVWDDLTLHLLNDRSRALTEEIGRSDNIITFKTRPYDAPATEILTYYDTVLELPVKQEFFSISGEQRTLQYSVEIKDLVTNVEDSMFEIAKNLRKVSLDEFYKLEK